MQEPQDYGHMYGMYIVQLTCFLYFPLSEFQHLFFYYHQNLWANHKLDYPLTVLSQHQSLLMQYLQCLHYINIIINAQVNLCICSFYTQCSYAHYVCISVTPYIGNFGGGKQANLANHQLHICQSPIFTDITKYCIQNGRTTEVF